MVGFGLTGFDPLVSGDWSEQSGLLPMLVGVRWDAKGVSDLKFLGPGTVKLPGCTLENSF